MKMADSSSNGSERRQSQQNHSGRSRYSLPRSSRLTCAKGLNVPSNISLLQLPPRAPELNSQENIGQFMRQSWLSSRIFNPSTTSPITAPGTRSSISRGKSCPSRAAIGQPQILNLRMGISKGEAASVLYDLMPAHNPAYLSDV
jgi:hypothetical protein